MGGWPQPRDIEMRSLPGHILEKLNPPKLPRSPRPAPKSKRTATGTQAILQQAQALEGIDADRTERDPHPWLLNCSNGTVDLRTGTLGPHQRGHRITKLCPVEYHPEATTPRWLQFMNEAFSGDSTLVDYMQWALGYSLTGCVDYHVFFALHGHGANGKSTLLTTVQTIFGK